MHFYEFETQSKEIDPGYTKGYVDLLRVNFISKLLKMDPNLELAELDKIKNRFYTEADELKKSSIILSFKI